MNITILARSPPASFFLCPKSSNKQGEELMNDIFENTETMKENEHPRFYTAESVMPATRLLLFRLIVPMTIKCRTMNGR